MFNKTKELLQLLKLPTNPQTIRTLDAAFGKGGCDDFTLTVESLTFVNTSSEAEKENLIMTYASNQEYFTVQPGGNIQKGIIPWTVFPFGSFDVLPSLSIRTDRTCCQDAIQVELVGEDIQDLADFVPLNFEVPEGESAIMIPLAFSLEAPFGPKIIGVQAIGCGQNKIKDLYFEYFDDIPCPDSIQVSTFLSGSTGYYTVYATLNFFLPGRSGGIAGDYEVELFKNGSSLGTKSGYTNGGMFPLLWSSGIDPWKPTDYHRLDIRFTTWEFSIGSYDSCGDYCGSYGSTGSFSKLISLFPCQPEPYYGSFAIGEDILGMFAIGEDILKSFSPPPGNTSNQTTSPASETK